MNFSSIISKFVSLSANCFLLARANSTFGDYILNFVKIDTEEANLINVGGKQRLVLLIVLNFFLPFLNDLFSRLLYLKIIKVPAEIDSKYTKVLKYFKMIKIGLDLAYKLAYLFKKKFLYSDFVEHILRIMTVNLGSKENFSDKFLNVGKQINLFFLYMFIRMGEWYYQKENKMHTIVEIKPPVKENLKICPICRQESLEIKQPMATRCCGFVFCEQCITDHLKSNTICPNCGFSISSLFLIKVYN
jgi:hypothetical protein